MRKLKLFGRVLWRSCTDPAYYKDIVRARASFSLKYLFVFAFLFSVVATVRYAYSFAAFLPKLPQYVAMAREKGAGFYPKDLVVTVKDGEVSTNVKEPYVIDFPFVLPADGDNKPEHLLVIDTKATAERFTAYKSVVVVGKNTVYYRDDKGYKFYPLTDMKGTTVINYALYDEWAGKVLPYLNYVPQIVYGAGAAGLLLLPFVLTTGRMAEYLFVLLVLTIFSLGLAKLLKKKLPYPTLYRLGMHAITVPVLMTYFFQFFGISVPFLFPLVFVGWMGVVLSRVSR